MRSGFRRLGILCGIATLIFWSSCDKHKLGELPEVQKEHVDLAKEAPAPATAPASPGASTSPTPGEFFPTASPR
jgi:hypothetical protein